VAEQPAEPMAVHPMERLALIREIIKAKNCGLFKNRTRQSLSLRRYGSKLVLELGQTAVIKLTISINTMCDALVTKEVSFLLEGAEFLYKGLVIAQFLEYVYKLSK
jgi:hypothetical protein